METKDGILDSDQGSPEPAHRAADAWKSFTGRERFSLTLGSVACGLLALGLSRVLHIPTEPGAAGSLLQQDSWWLAIGIAWLIAIGGTVLGAIFTLRLHYDAGLFCAGVGLAVLSSRLGSMKYVLFTAEGQSIFLVLAIELLLLWIAVFVGWLILCRMGSHGLLAAEVILDPTEPDLSIDQKALATLAQAMLMVILLLFLCQSDAKAHVLAAVAIASFLGALGAHHFVTTRPSVWFWSAPMLVGIFGYVMQYFVPASDMTIGDVNGFFGPLARPTPLDYMSLGTAGTILGYWTSQQWHHESIAAAEST